MTPIYGIENKVLIPQNRFFIIFIKPYYHRALPVFGFNLNAKPLYVHSIKLSAKTGVL